MKKTLLFLIISFSTLALSGFAQEQNEIELASFSKIKEEGKTKGYQINFDNLKTTKGTIKTFYRNWQFNYTIFKKNFTNQTSFTFLLDKPYQKYFDSFVLEKVQIQTPKINKTIFLEKQFYFNHLLRKQISQDISFSNLTYNKTTGNLTFSLKYETQKNYAITSFIGKTLNDSTLLFNKQFPINQGDNTIKISTQKNLSSFFVQANPNNLITEYSIQNNIVYYPYKNQEFCGDNIDNNNNNLIDENCFNNCPKIIPKKGKITFLECGKKNWSLYYSNNFSNITYSNKTKTIIQSKTTTQKNLSINSQVPFKITTQKSTQKQCSGFPTNLTKTIPEDSTYKIILDPESTNPSTSETMPSLEYTPLK